MSAAFSILSAGTSAKRKRRKVEEAGEKDVAVKDTAEEPPSAEALKEKFHIHTTGLDAPDPLAEWAGLSQYNVDQRLIDNLILQKFTTPTPIQRQAIPALLNGHDLLVCAPTGSGKTLAFALPLLQKVIVQEERSLRGLIVCPTRELASQIANEFKKLTRGMDLNIGVMGKSQSVEAGNQPEYDILISTPLRLVYAVDAGIVDLSTVTYFVLDEADRLFEKQFVEQTDRLLLHIKTTAQKSLFSATLPVHVEELARTVSHDPIRIVVGQSGSANQDINQQLVFAGSEQGKLLSVRQMFRDGSLPPPTLIFCQSIERTQALYDELKYDGVKVGALHSGQTQEQRENTLRKFRNGEVWVLISSEVLSRGVDVAAISTVINYDFPSTAHSYIHRIGRTARAGRQGRAVTFFTKDDMESLRTVVNVMKASGYHTPDWMENLPKVRKTLSKPVRRDEIRTYKKPKQFRRRVSKWQIGERENAAKEKIGE